MTLVNLGVNTMEMAMMMLVNDAVNRATRAKGQHQRGERYQSVYKALHHKVILAAKIGAGDPY